jgi:hypothetical protein
MLRRYFLLLCFLQLVFSTLSAQQLSGVVMDAQGRPLPFASILANPGNHSTISNEKGRYEISLPAGKYDIQIHYLGFNALKSQVVVGVQGLQRDFKLEPQVFELNEIKINARAEDPAYAIMRRAIRNAPLHLASVESYTAKSYVKGSFIVNKAPWVVRKLMDESNIKVGTTYLLESMSEISFRQPDVFQEKVVSIRSNLPPGSNPTINFANFNFYRPVVGEIISPLSPKAFQHYRFVYRGEKLEDGKKLIRIGLLPRAKGPYLPAGDLYLLEPHLSLYSIDVRFTDDNGIRYHLQQQFQEFNQLWMPVKQDVALQVNYLGAVADVRYITSVRNYRIEPDASVLAMLQKPLAEKLQEGSAGNQQVKKEVKKLKKRVEESQAVNEDDPVREYSFEIDSLARRQPDSVWNSLRQLPLEEQEIIGYRQADSLYEARGISERRDSLESLPVFRWYHPITGHTYRLGEYIDRVGWSRQLRYDGLAFGVVPMADIYNTVEGFVLTSRWRYTTRKSRMQSTEFDVRARYSIARNRPLLNAKYTYNQEKYSLRLSGGTAVKQINPIDPVPPSVNLLQTVLFNDNILFLYEKAYAQLGATRILSSKLSLNGQLEYARRTPLNNTDRLAFWNDPAGLSPNNPANEEMGNTAFEAHNYVGLQLDMQWRPWAETVRINGEERVLNRDRPFFTFKANSGFTPDWFQSFSFGVNQNRNLYRGNSLFYHLEVGSFLRKPSYFMDYTHFSGFQSLLQSNETESYRNLPYYRFSTAGPYLSVFSRVRMGRLALTRIEKVRMYGLDEALFASTLITGSVRHFEVGYNVSGPFRIIGTDFFVSFNSIEPTRGGLRFRLGI